jgi:hypothetical protein
MPSKAWLAMLHQNDRIMGDSWRFRAIRITWLLNAEKNCGVLVAAWMIACVGGLVVELTYGRRNRNVGVICAGTMDRRTVKIGVEWYGKKASSTSSVLYSCILRLSAFRFIGS